MKCEGGCGLRGAGRIMDGDVHAPYPPWEGMTASPADNDDASGTIGNERTEAAYEDAVRRVM